MTQLPFPPAAGAAGMQAPGEWVPASAAAPEAVQDAQEWAGINMAEVLDADSRPTFVIDLDPDEESPASTPASATDGTSGLSSKPILPVFCNAALRTHERLLEALVGIEAQGLLTADSLVGGGEQEEGEQDRAEQDGDDTTQSRQPTYEEFKAWATGVTPHDDSKDVFPSSLMYGNMLWTGSTVRKRWRMVAGNCLWRDGTPVCDLSSGTPPEVASSSASRSSGKRGKKAKSLKVSAAPVEAKVDTTTRQRSDETQGSLVTGSTTLVSPMPQDRAKPDYFPKVTGGSSEETGLSTQSASILLSSPEKAVTDWTVAEPKGILTPHQQYARTVNWAATPLGPMDQWPPSFRQVANLVFGNPHPAALFWGADLTMLYNEAYAREVAGNKHPSLMGTGFSGPFAELWDSVSPIFSECARTGISVRKENDYLPINRHGFLEETFYSWTWTPIYGGTDKIQGFYNAPFETTKQVILQRRRDLLSRIGEFTAQAKAVKQFWGYVLDGLQDNHFDVPFALLYSVGESEEDHSSISSESTISLKSCHLEGAIGVPDGHPAAPQQLDLKRSREGFVPSFREAMRTREPTLLHTRDGTLPEALLEGIEWRGFGDPCQHAIIFPVRPTNGDNVLAFLVLGVNPRRPYNDEYRAFTSMLNRQLATSLASVILYEDEIRRSRDAAEAAALEKEQLTRELGLQASRLRRMTELSPLGMFLISPEGVLREANDRFYEMTGHTRDTHTEYEMSWTDSILPGSVKTMQEGWRTLVEDHQPWSGELQLKKPQQPAGSTGRSTVPVGLQVHGEAIDYWVLFIAQPELHASDDGMGPPQLRSIMGSITDISHLKWAQGLQDRRLHEAEETRRQQNEFIDITSHEMRNPLSAILQCADDIISALGEHHRKGTAPPEAVVEAAVDAAQTIALCVQHQKSIVDDILTISKLDSNLLLLNPSPARPDDILRRAVKMFDPELQAKGIEMKVESLPSYKDLRVDWVTIDPSRVLQILINLLTNGIKFTAQASQRHITVAVGASLGPPDPTHLPGFQYVPAVNPIPDVTAGEEWGSGEVLYIRFKVRDTGCGITEAHKRMLFQRFKQASPRTHDQYGGSGLGLFISKRLAELHGGQIGVSSIAGEGSLFGFYVQTRRAQAPAGRHPHDDESLAIERDLGAGEAVVQHGVTPQRQDFATSNDDPGAGLTMVADKAREIESPESEIGESISFRFTPINVMSAPSSPVAERQPLDPASLHVLVVEDNLINQKVLVKQLAKAGCAVEAANDGIEALAFLASTHFCRSAEAAAASESTPTDTPSSSSSDATGTQTQARPLSIILMDLEMPNMDGLTCVREIRRMQASGKVRGHVPVIAVTANVRDEQVAAARRNGMDEVVSKPFRIPDLLRKIEGVLAVLEGR